MLPLFVKTNEEYGTHFKQYCLLNVTLLVVLPTFMFRNFELYCGVFSTVVVIYTASGITQVSPILNCRLYQSNYKFC
jgi:hypothetical protein